MFTVWTRAQPQRASEVRTGLSRTIVNSHARAPRILRFVYPHEMPTEPPRKLFLSHASADAGYVEAFMDRILISGCGLDEDSILNTSIRSTGVPTGYDLFGHLRDAAETSPLVVAIISPTYLTRATCLAEMGAAWVLKTLFPILTTGMARDDVLGPLKPLLIEGMKEEKHTLNDLQRRIQEEFSIARTFQTWERHRDNWIALKEREELLGSIQAEFSKDDYDHQIAVLEKENSELRVENAALRKKTEPANKSNSSTRTSGNTVRALRKKATQVAPSPDTKMKHLEHLVNDAREAIKQVEGGPATSDILRHAVIGDELGMPNDRMSELYQEYKEAVDAGLLHVYEDGSAAIATEFYGLAEAMETLDALNLFIRKQAKSDADFAKLFAERYEVTPSLTASKTWDTLLYPKVR